MSRLWPYSGARIVAASLIAPRARRRVMFCALVVVQICGAIGVDRIPADAGPCDGSSSGENGVSSMRPSDLKRLALLMAVTCVRNTVIEDYHADGKLSDEEMKRLNQEVANKIYTFLHYLFTDSPHDQAAFLSAMGMMYPSNWDQPKLDASFVESVKLVKKMTNSIDEAPARRLPRSPSRSPQTAAKTKKGRPPA